MPARTSSDLDSSVIGVLDPNGRIIGTGFVATEQLIITCAHVVEDARSGPGKAITVRFHLNAKIQEAQVLPEYWLPSQEVDIAILQLEGRLPTDIMPVVLGESTGRDGHRFLSLGYPLMGDYVGIGASGRIERRVPKASGQWMLQLTSSQLAQGHSGAPVWDETDKCVVAMISEVYRPGQDSKNRDTAFATPVENLWQICPELIQPRGWPTRVVEFNTLLGMTQSIKDPPSDGGRTIDLRRGDALDRLDSPFDELAHTVDVRRINSKRTRGRYNITNVGMIAWRLKLYSVTQTPAFCLEEVGPHCYLFNVLGIDTRLYKHPQDESELTHAASDLNLVLSRRALEMDLKESGSKYYGEGKSLAIWAHNWLTTDASQLIPADKIIVADLSDWQYRPPRDHIVIDPILGRIVFPPNQLPRRVVRVSYYHGFSGDLGGGEYDRSLLQSTDAKVYLVGKQEVFKHIGDALEQWQRDQTSDAIIEITDSNTYVEIINVNLSQGQSLQIRAANRARPIVRQLNWRTEMPDAFYVDMARGSRFTIDGVLIIGFGVKVHMNDQERASPIPSPPDSEEIATLRKLTNIESDNVTNPAELNVRHCTFVPGWALYTDWEPASPFEFSLELFNLRAHVNIEHSILGSIRIHEDLVTTEPIPINITDSILDATSSEREALGVRDRPIVLTIKRCTVFGMVDVYALELAENCIFNGRLNVEQQESGLVQFCYVPHGCRTPRRLNCQPDLAEKAAEAELLKLNRNATRAKIEIVRQRARERVLPQFTHLRYGQPGYTQLAETCADEIKRGADDASEMGVFHDLHQERNVANLRARLDEYAKAGNDTGIIYAS